MSEEPKTQSRSAGKKSDKVKSGPIKVLDDAGTESVTRVVKKLSKSPNSKQAIVGPPSKLSKAAQKSRVITATSGSAFSSAGYGGIGGGYGGMMGSSGYGSYGSGSVAMGSGGNVYSPELSTDFLELPQSLDEKRNFYRFFYNNDPFIGQAIDLHCELPLSKVRIGIPRTSTKAFEGLARQAFDFCSRWADEIELMDVLMMATHEYNLIGEVFLYVEDENPDMPLDIMNRPLEEGEDPDSFESTQKGEDGSIWVPREDGNERAIQWLKLNYRGWTGIQIIPPEKIEVVSYPFTKEKSYNLLLSDAERQLFTKAQSGDPEAIRIIETYPATIIEALATQQKGILMNTDPSKGAYLIHMVRKRSGYDTRGRSILERVMQTVVHRDKIRQSLASITSRHMTPIRLVSVESGDVNDVEVLREQVDLALQDPDYSIITNFTLEWNEVGADARIPDWSSEFDRTDRLLYAGLGVTESLLSGEGAYQGDRLNLEVINTRYANYREMLQHLVERKLLEPMCRIMGFIEEIPGERPKVLTPPMTFTRMALRDNADTFDHLFNLYQKGSLSVETLFDLMNLDPKLEHDRIQQEMFTPRDSTFNEALRGAYGEVGRKIAEETDIFDKVAKNLGLKIVEKKEERF